MRGRMPAHLVRRGEFYYFRRALPRHLAHRFGRRELKFSLRTRDALQARLRCRVYSNRFDALVAAVDRMPTLDKQKIESLVRTFFEGLLSQAEEVVFLMRDDDFVDIKAEIVEAEAQREAIQERIALGKIDTTTKLEAEELVHQTTAAGTKLGLDDFEMLCHGILRARAEQRRIISAMLRGAYDETVPRDPLFEGMKSPGLPPLAGEEAEGGAGTIAAVIGKYSAFKTNWVAKTRDENLKVLGWFCDHVGPERRIKDVTIQDVRAFRDMLLKLPKNFSKMAKFKGKTLGEIAALEPNGPHLGAGTLHKYFGCVCGFLQWCDDESYVETSPAKKIKIGQKPDVYEARQPFSLSQLQEIFQSPQYTGHKSPSRRLTPGDLVIRDGKFWIPLVGLFTGMRLGEIVQLRIADVREDGGNPYFDVNTDEDKKKTLKTKSSERMIPIHKELNRIGFVSYVEAQRAKEPDGRLFPEIKAGKNGYYSHNFSKYFGRYLKDTGVKSPKVAFHSFRHNFTDALRVAGAEDSHIKALLGHSDASVTAIYGSQVPLKVLSSDLSKMSYDLDLSHLYVEGFSPE